MEVFSESAVAARQKSIRTELSPRLGSNEPGRPNGYDRCTISFKRSLEIAPIQPQLPRSVKVVGWASLLFGFLATFEPSDTPGEFLAFGISYVVLGLGGVAGLIVLIVKAVRR